MKNLNFRQFLETEEKKPKARLSTDKVLVIMRGLPGSGKSNKARRVLQKLGGNPDGHIFSADNFFIPETRKRRKMGEFVSDAEELAEYKRNFDINSTKKAHAATMQEFKAAVDQGITPLILDNTNVQPSNAQAYAEYADKAGYVIKIEEPDSPWWTAGRDLFGDKKTNREALEKFAADLHGRQQHGVPLQGMLDYIDKWKHNMSVEDILGRPPTPRYKFR